MRLACMHLLSYGHFTDTSLSFERRPSDLHIVYGPNEAGKTTTMRALEDLLFGIPHNSALNFIHDYRSMRIGARLESGDEALDVVRRKGNKSTLLTPDGTPDPQAAATLSRWLAGVDQAFFARMFSLDHQRLREGGDEMLQAEGDIGQMLFAASAGIRDLRRIVDSLEEEADAQWAPRKAAHRRYYQAQERYEAAQQQLLKFTVTAREWQRLQRECEEAESAYSGLSEQHAQVAAQQRRLNRIRRVYAPLQHLTALRGERSALEEIVLLPVDAKATFDKARAEVAELAARMDTLAVQLAGERDEQAKLCDEPELLQHAEEIDAMHARRIRVLGGRDDLPELRARLVEAQAQVCRQGSELGRAKFSAEELLDGLPAHSAVARVRELLQRHGVLETAAAGARRALDEARTHAGQAKQTLDSLPEPVDVTVLRAAVDGTRDAAGLAVAIRDATEKSSVARLAIERRLQALQPPAGNVETLALLPVPTPEAVEDSRQRLEDGAAQVEKCRERLAEIGERLDGLRGEEQRALREGNAVSQEQLASVREHRDHGWQLIRRRYVEGQTLEDCEYRSFANTSPAALPDAFEQAVAAADRLADRRFDHAEAAARLAYARADIGEAEQELGRRRQVLQEAQQAHQESVQAWRAMWQEAGIDPLSPGEMARWLQIREEILELVEQRDAALQRLATLRRDEQQARAAVVEALRALGEAGATDPGAPLSVLRERAASACQHHDRLREERQRCRDTLERAETEQRRRAGELQEAERAMAAWRRDWESALHAAGLDPQAAPSSIDAQLSAIQAMRELEGTIDELRTRRIGMIEAYIRAFEDDARELVERLAPELAEERPERAVAELEERLAASRQAREQRRSIEARITRIEKQTAECTDRREQAQRTLAALQTRAGVADADALREAIDRSDRRRELDQSIAALSTELEQQGDGQPLTVLEEECRGQDLDQVASRAQELERERLDLQARLNEAYELRSTARRALEAVGGSDRAARAEADRQAAITEMQDAAARYALVRASADMLSWAIERFRQDKQAPLLDEAGRLFATLTGGSFSSLRMGFDERDRPLLSGVRPDASEVDVSGMSTGSADQLYLALRVAALTDYLQRAPALPFVADDLFTNFDDERAAAGFRVLGELARHTQVLFFTHHRHLLDVARGALGSDISVLSLLPD